MVTLFTLVRSVLNYGRSGIDIESVGCCANRLDKKENKLHILLKEKSKDGCVYQNNGDKVWIATPQVNIY